MFSSTLLLPLATLAALVHGHGYILTPSMRMPGNTTTSACGTQVVEAILSDKTSHVEGLPEIASTDPDYDASKCNLWLCRGVQYEEDGDDAPQTYALGEIVNIKINLTIPHLGSANVSVVDTKTDTIVGEGEPLLLWSEGYADELLFYGDGLPANQTDFNITIPDTLEGKCAEAGECVIQWWWYGEGADQTYESCIDFTIASD
ncbi:hypothetical protein GGS20DRAFT_380217 [Poronia punctata]|nr:hypothetical protein GGS20DRAFT_380217 [Poronia punctata]